MNLKDYLAGKPILKEPKGKPLFRTILKTWLFFRKTLKTGDFIVLETLCKREDLLAICKFVVGGNDNDFTIFDSGYIISEYQKKTKIKTNFKYIYGGEILSLKPPIQNKEPDWNAPLRERFVNDYGDLMELVYLICNGNMLKQKEVAKLPFDEFLTIGQYLLRKRHIES